MGARNASNRPFRKMAAVTADRAAPSARQNETTAVALKSCFSALRSLQVCLIPNSQRWRRILMAGTVSHLSVLKGFRCSVFKESISACDNRCGIQFAMEGYVSGVSVEEDSGGFLIRGTCFASFEKRGGLWLLSWDESRIFGSSHRRVNAPQVKVTFPRSWPSTLCCICCVVLRE